MKSVLYAFFALFVSFTVSADYSAHPSADAFVTKMVQEHGFSEADIRGALSNAKKKNSILKAISRPAEKRLTWEKYSKIFLTKNRVVNGRQFMEKYKDTLARAEEKYGVPKEIITAIIGVETRYGGNMGSYRVIDALATLGFDYEPRSKFFTKELEEMFLLAREQGFDPLKLEGSYAGAMGYGQFISSSYRHYAVDFDGDDVADILNNPIDAIGSVANYFKAHHWKTGRPVAAPVQFGEFDYQPFLQKKLKPKHRMADLRAEGFDQFEAISGDEPTRVLVLQGANGEEQWLAWHNFYVITRYNHSHLYAMAVYQLSKEFSAEK